MDQQQFPWGLTSLRKEHLCQLPNTGLPLTRKSTELLQQNLRAQQDGCKLLIKVYKMEKQKQSHVMSHNKSSVPETAQQTCQQEKEEQAPRIPQTNFSTKALQDRVFTVVSKRKASFSVAAFTEVFMEQQ